MISRQFKSCAYKKICKQKIHFHIALSHDPQHYQPSEMLWLWVWKVGIGVGMNKRESIWILFGYTYPVITKQIMLAISPTDVCKFWVKLLEHAFLALTCKLRHDISLDQPLVFDVFVEGLVHCSCCQLVLRGNLNFLRDHVYKSS